MPNIFLLNLKYFIAEDDFQIQNLALKHYLRQKFIPMIYFKNTLFSIALILLTVLQCSAQEFLESNAAFSYKKTAYVYLENGDSVVGVITKIGFKKGIVDEVKIKKEGEKKAVEVEMNTIKMAYFPVSNLGLLQNKLDIATDLRRVESSRVNETLINDGYVFFEKTETILKGKNEILMLKLINPAFCSKIRVYKDPISSETTSYGVGGFNLAGGEDRSYYIKVGNNPAKKVKVTTFKDHIHEIFGDCPSLETRLMAKFDWSDLAKYVVEHENCN